MIYDASEGKAIADYKWALAKIKPKPNFKKIIIQTRKHSYLRNMRVESFFNVEYGAGFAYDEVAKRANFNPELIMEVTIPEMIDFLRKRKSLPGDKEMKKRIQNYAMTVKNGVTTLITNKEKIKEIAKKYYMYVEKSEIIHGKVACLGGVIKGRAKICLDKNEIGKVKKGDILVANFTTPDFTPAMEKAAAIVADQGGLSSHAAIVSRELGVPCVMATKNGSRVIHENDLIEVNAKTGVIKILERAK
jgi:phosphohistidine swiveling domain-containing protein